MALPQRLQDLAARVSNAGRWGTDDRRGTLNLIDAAAVRRGVQAARQGKTFLLSIPFDEDGPQTGIIPGRNNPKREMLGINASMTGDINDFCTSDDKVEMGVQAATHWDALAHVGYSGKLYNHVPFDSVDESGAHELGIDKFGPVVTRGVLLDVARVHGVEYFDEGYPITAEDLDKAEQQAGVTVEPGDIVLVRTGQMHWLEVGEK